MRRFVAIFGHNGRDYFCCLLCWRVLCFEVLKKKKNVLTQSAEEDGEIDLAHVCGEIYARRSTARKPLNLSRDGGVVTSASACIFIRCVRE